MATSDMPLFTSTPTTTGICTLRDGTTKLSYEIHGTGQRRVVLVMGLLASRYSWRETLAYLTSDKSIDCSVLLFDNRGCGRSSAPWGRYTTTMLASDVLDLLDHVGWTEERSIHVNGVSMGGMISLELALLAGSRMKSLTLTSTCAKHQNPPRTRAESALGWVHFFRPKTTYEAKVNNMMNTLFSSSDAWWATKGGDGKTNRERVFAILMNRVSKQTPPPISGQIGQISACLTHNCSFASLAKIGEIVPDILIITGAKDKLIDPKCSDEMYNEISVRGTRQSIRKIVYPETGHALPVERDLEYHQEFQKNMDAGDTRWH